VSYAKYCALCHAADGSGYAADHAPSLKNDRFLRSADDAFIARSISLGRPNTPMAAYSKDLGGPLSDADVDELVAWMRAGRPSLETLPATHPGDAAAGAVLYASTCQKCHGDPATRV
jgi:mono/diheme cytochrome c family protein